MSNLYQLPLLPYAYNALEPNISAKQLQIHHDLHHKTYVDSANQILETLETARPQNKPIDLKAKLKELSFNLGGHILHSLFWENLTPSNKPTKPSLKLEKILTQNFSSLDRFKAEFSQTANSAEGSAWAALAYDTSHQNLFLMQIEKHNLNIYPGLKILLVLDVWEHAYYLDYQNKRPKFVENFWNIINWNIVEARLT